MILPLRVSDICYHIMKLNCVKLKIETGKSDLEACVLRAIMAETKSAADLVEPYDAAFVSGQYGDALVLAQKALRRGASAVVLNNGTCSADTRRLIAELCARTNVPLIEIEEYVHFAVAKDLFDQEIDAFEQKRAKLGYELQNMLIFQNNPHSCAAMMEAYGICSDQGYCVAALKFVCKQDALPDQQMLCKAERLAEIGMNEVIAETAAVVVGSCVALIGGGREEETVNKAIQSAIAALPENLMKRYEIYVGTGRTCDEVEHLPESFAIASRVAGIQAVRKQEKSVLSYEELGISKLLMEIDCHSRTAKAFYADTLRPLVEHDRNNGTDLVNFLRAYFEYGGRVKIISEKLYMHRNSVNYNVNKISGIVKRDLSDMCDRAEILVALRLFELMFGEDTL